MTAPNIVMIMVDQWRADCFGLAGHPVVETPNLDAVFGKGTVFEHAYAAVPSCIPARASLLTGMSHRHHGRVGYRDEVHWPYPNTFPATLAGAGYQTHCVGKMHVWPARARLGFHDVDLHDGYLHAERKAARDYTRVDDYVPWLRQRANAASDMIDAGLGCNGYSTRPWPLEEALHPNSWAVTRALDFLRRRDPTRPFFLKVSFHRPHPPLDPPAWALERYRDVALPEPVTGDWVDPRQTIGGFTHDDSPVPASPRAIHLARCAYYAQLTHIDNQLNRLMHALIEDDLLAGTALLFLGDHGEMLYDHRKIAKMQPYEASARVPLMLRLPAASGQPKRDRVRAPVELMDVYPTLCELAGVDTPETVDGRSVLPLVRGEDAPWRDVLHGEHYIYSTDDNHWLTDGRYKYVWFSQSGREHLFDLESDPQEIHDLAGSSATDLASWRARLASELSGREEGFVVDGALAPGEAVGRPILEEAGLLTDEQVAAQRTQIAGIKAYMARR